MTRMMLFTLSLATLTACTGDGEEKDQTPYDTHSEDTGAGGEVDEDGDGSPADEDCDDTDPAINPDAVEVCDGLDNNCDGSVDEGVTTTYYADNDGDGFGDDAVTVEACAAEEGWVQYGGDCDDDDARFNPVAAELDCTDPNDYNCDGSVGYADADGDGFAACLDCDDNDASVSPTSNEYCDGIDNNCDGQIDELAFDGTTWYLDADQDGYGDANMNEFACEAPSGYVSDSSDCDDADGAVNPGAAEVCNDVDDDCDSLIDDADDSLDASTADTYFADDDGDGYGDVDDSTQACDQPSGTSEDNSDCDDSDSAVNPGATEVCNAVDDDCDGLIDDADSSLDSATASTWYADADYDGFGDVGAMSLTCDQPSGTVTDSSDCDDSNANIYPGATEVCDNVDNDCDGDVDDDDSSLNTSSGSTFYDDVDGDGYGDAASSTEACDAPSGTVSDNSDCDDGDSAVNPGATEECDAIDNDCDGVVDGVTLVYEDFDATLGSDWVLNGTATQTLSGTSGYLSLTETSGGTATAWYADTLPADVFTVTFDFATGGGSGADGLGFGWLDPSVETTASLGIGGGGIGLYGLTGYGVEADTYYNGGIDPNGNHLGLINLSSYSSANSLDSSTAIPTLENGGWFTMLVEVDSGVVDVYMDAQGTPPTTQYLSGSTISGYGLTEAIFGFGAATGGSTNYHYIDNVVIECPEL